MPSRNIRTYLHPFGYRLKCGFFIVLLKRIYYINNLISNIPTDRFIDVPNKDFENILELSN